MKQRLALFALIIIATALGFLATYEVWQGLGFERIGIRDGGVRRSETPVLFWTRFAVELLIASLFWLAVVFFTVLRILSVWSGKK